jgi:WD40 repeat protein
VFDAITGHQWWSKQFGEQRPDSNPLPRHCTPLAFSPDGRFLAVLTHPPKRRDTWVVYLFETRTGLLESTLLGIDGIGDMQFAADGKTLLVRTAGDKVTPWPVPQVVYLPLRETAHALSPDGKTLAVGHYDGTVLFLDPVTRRAARPPLSHDLPVAALAFASGSQLLVVLETNGSGRPGEPDAGFAVAWKLDQVPRMLLRAGFGGRYYTCLGPLFRIDDTTLMLTSFQGLQVYDLATGQLRGTIARDRLGESHQFTALIGQERMYNFDREENYFLSDEEVLVVTHHQMERWNVKTGQRTAILWSIAPGQIQCMRHAGGLASMAGQTEPLPLVALTRWAISHEKMWEELHAVGISPRLTPSARSPDGRTLAVSVTQHQWVTDRDFWLSGLHLLDLASGQRRRIPLPLPGWDDRNPTRPALAFAPDGQTLAVLTRPDEVAVVDVATATVRRRVPINWVKEKLNLALSSDGQTLATQEGEMLALWDVSTGHLLHHRHLGERCQRGYVSGQAALAMELLAWKMDRHDLGRSDGPVLPVGLLLTPAGEVIETPGPVDVEVPPSPEVRALAASPDGKLLAGARDGAWVTLWDLATKQERCRIRALDGLVTSLAFAGDGKLWTGGTDGDLAQWDVAVVPARLLIRTPAHPGGVEHLACSGRVLASAGVDNVVKIWDLTTDGTARLRHDFREHAGPVVALALSPDGRRVLSVGRGAADILLWDAQTNKILARLQGHTAAVLAVTFAPSGDLLATGGMDQTVRLWEADGTSRATLSTAVPVGGVTFAADSCRVLAGTLSPRRLVWDVPPRRLQDRKGNWERPRQEIVENGSWQEHSAGCSCPTSAPDGISWATGTQSGQVALWGEANPGQLPGQLRWVASLRASTSRVLGVHASAGGRWLAGMSMDGTVRIWERRTGRLAAGPRDHPHRLTQAAFAGRAAILATGDGRGEIRLWDLETGTSRVVVEATGQPSGHLALSGDGGRLLVGAGKDQMLVFDTGDGKQLGRRTIHGAQRMSWSFDGQSLAVAHQQKVTLFNAAFEEPRELSGLEGFGAFAFSADGRTLAVATPNHGVQLWQVATGRKLLDLADSDSVQALAFTADGRALRALTGDRVREWLAVPQ